MDEHFQVEELLAVCASLPDDLLFCSSILDIPKIELFAFVFVTEMIELVWAPFNPDIKLLVNNKSDQKPSCLWLPCCSETGTDSNSSFVLELASSGRGAVVQLAKDEETGCLSLSSKTTTASRLAAYGR